MKITYHNQKTDDKNKKVISSSRALDIIVLLAGMGIGAVAFTISSGNLLIGVPIIIVGAIGIALLGTVVDKDIDYIKSLSFAPDTPTVTI